MSPGKKSPSKAAKKRKKSRVSLPEYVIFRLLEIPRIARILMVGIFAPAVTWIIALVAFYESIFYSGALQIVLYFIATVLGLLMYLAGWYLIVGTVGATPPVRRAIWWYLIVGILALILIVLWIIQVATAGTGAV